MSHTIRDKQKLLNRVRRIKGQMEAIERALEDERGCIDVLQQITSCRGAKHGLLAVVLEAPYPNSSCRCGNSRRAGRQCN